MHRALIVTALPIEYQSVRSYLTDLQEVIHPSGIVYELGKFITDKQDWEVAIAETGAGNAGVAVQTERAIAFFNPEVLMLVGIAGGIKDVKNGDVVVANKVYAYESGKAVGGEFQPRPETFPSSYTLVQRARSEARKSNWLQRLSEVPSSPPKVFIAPIASGEKVIASSQDDTFMFLRSNYSDAIAVDMESHGLLSAAYAYSNIATLVIRGISDLVNTKYKDIVDFPQELAANHAGAFAFTVLANIPLEDTDTKVRDSLVQRVPFDLGQLSSQQGSHPIGQGISISRYFDLKNPCLNAEKYADALATVLSNAEGEVCFAVFGHWGRGKTYLMKLVEDKLPKEKYECVWFSAWKYRTKPEIWIHLYEKLRIKATSGDNLLINLSRKFRIFLVKSGLKVAFSFIILLAVSLVIPLGVVGVIIIPALLFLGIAYSARLGMGLFGTWRNLSIFTGLSRKSFQIAEHQEKLGLQEVIGEDLRSLLIGWVGFSENNIRIRKNIIKFWKKIYLYVYIFLIFMLSIVIHASMGATNSQLSKLMEFIGDLPGSTLYGVEVETLLPTLEKMLSGLIVSDLVRIFFPGLVFIIFLIPLLCLTRIGIKTSKVLLIVDDLDRLPSNEILEIIESLKLLLEGEIKELIQIVVICEERFLGQALCEKYSGPYNIENMNERSSLIEENIQKLFVSHLRLPPINIEEQRIFMSNLIGYEPSDNPGDDEGQQTGLNPAKKSKVDDPQKPEYASNMVSRKLHGGMLVWLNPVQKLYGKLSEWLNSVLPNKSDGTKTSPHPTDSGGESKSLKTSGTREYTSSSQSSRTNISEDLEYGEKVALYESLSRLSAWVTLGPRALQSFVFRYKLARQLLKARGTENIDASELAQLLAIRLSGQLPNEAVIDEDIKNVLEEVA